MERALAPLISAHTASGEARVDHAELRIQLAALHPQCFGWAMACCERRREDAEDVLHDVYLGVLDSRLRFDGRSTLKTWLYGVIRNASRARLRRDRLRALLGMSSRMRIDGPAPPATPAEQAIATDDRERTLRALGRLAARQREVLLLVFYHDLTIEEASTVMRVSVGAARVHYARGKKRLASLLENCRR
jgi:RNA polymerase sigma factor (sigma-70 family)